MNLDDLLKNDREDFRFRPDYGAFRARLTDILLAGESEEFADLFSEGSSDILAGITGSSLDEAVVRFQVFSAQGERSLECRLSQLTREELDDLKGQLSDLDGSPATPGDVNESRSVVRKKAEIDLHNMFTIDEASGQLNLSRQALKSRIPCSDYSYIEVDGKVEIKEYYWSKDLIKRLCDIKANGAKPDDIKYFADECCHGDLDWAKDVLGTLTQKGSAPNRDNQAQKGGGKQPSPGANQKSNNHHHHHRNRSK